MSSGTVISYPIPPYQNLPIQAEFYLPRRFVIEDIVLGLLTTVTTTTDMDYVVGQEVRLLVPNSFGSYQLNGRTGFVVDLPTSNSVTLDINSSQDVDNFTTSSSTTLPQILAIGDINLGATNSEGRVNNDTTIPGAFRNISPR
jgi:hypothetical protein